MSGYDLDPGTESARQAQRAYAEQSDAVVASRSARLDLSYGEDERHRFDLFQADQATGLTGDEHRPTPVIVFFHGGYWTAGSKDTRRFPALPWTRRGVAWCPVQYRLTPAARIADLVHDARQAVVSIARQADYFGLRRDSIHLAGNSAGAHLAAMVAAQDWSDTPELSRPQIRSLTAVSGLFDLEPLLHERPNEWLRADEHSLRANSPLYRLPPAGTDVIVAWGADETDAFEDQSRRYASACDDSGLSCRQIVVPEAGHFEIIGEFANPDGKLFSAMELAPQAADGALR